MRETVAPLPATAALIGERRERGRAAADRSKSHRQRERNRRLRLACALAVVVVNCAVPEILESTGWPIWSRTSLC